FVLMVTGIWFVLSTGRSIPAQAIISNVPSPAQRGSFMSFNSSVQQLFTGVASLISGAIVYADADGRLHNYQWVGYLSVAIVCSCLFTVGLLNKRVLQREQQKEPDTTLEAAPRK